MNASSQQRPFSFAFKIVSTKYYVKERSKDVMKCCNFLITNLGSVCDWNVSPIDWVLGMTKKCRVNFIAVCFFFFGCGGNCFMNTLIRMQFQFHDLILEM